MQHIAIAEIPPVAPFENQPPPTQLPCFQHAWTGYRPHDICGFWYS